VLRSYYPLEQCQIQAIPVDALHLQLLLQLFLNFPSRINYFQQVEFLVYEGLKLFFLPSWRLCFLDSSIMSCLCTGLGCTTVVYPESAALAAAQIHALHDHIIWSRLRVKQLKNLISLKVADKTIRNTALWLETYFWFLTLACIE